MESQFSQKRRSELRSAPSSITDIVDKAQPQWPQSYILPSCLICFEEHMTSERWFSSTNYVPPISLRVFAKRF